MRLFCQCHVETMKGVIHHLLLFSFFIVVMTMKFNSTLNETCFSARSFALSCLFEDAAGLVKS